MIVVLVRVKLNPNLAPPYTGGEPMSEKIAALKGTWPILLVMVGIFGGLFGGIFTPTEAGAIGAFLACLVAAVQGELSWGRFRKAGEETVTATAALIVIAIGATLLTRFLTLSGAGDYISESVLSIGASPAMLLLGVILIYLLMGMFLEPLGAMLLTLPIVLPIVGDAGWSLVWFGVVLCKLLEIGMITPPIGMNVFVIKGVVGNLVSTTQIFRGVFWFLVMDLFVLAILAVFPDIILFLPEMLGN